MVEVVKLAVRPNPNDREEDVSKHNPFPVAIEAAGRVGDIRTGQVAVQTTATLIVPANPNRLAIKITQITGSQACYWGKSSSVATTTGDFIGSTAGGFVVTGYQGAIYGIANSSAQTVSFVEELAE